MKKTIVWLITATILIIIGTIILAGALTMNKWDLTKLNATKFETNNYEINEEFKNISIDTDTADIVFALSDDGNTKVICYEEEKMKHSVKVEEETLNIEIVNTKKWYDYIGIHFGTPEITVYLPDTEYTSLLIKESTGDVMLPMDFKFQSIDIEVSTGDVSCFACALKSVNITASTGDIYVEGITTGSLNLCTSTGRITGNSVICDENVNITVSTGKTELTDVSCKSLNSAGSTGSILLKNVIASDAFSITRDTGNVKFEGCDAAELFIETDTGSVSGTLLSDKIFMTESDTGSINVPKTVTGGKCEIKTDTGSIRIEIQK